VCGICLSLHKEALLTNNTWQRAWKAIQNTSLAPPLPPPPPPPPPPDGVKRYDDLMALPTALSLQRPVDSEKGHAESTPDPSLVLHAEQDVGVPDPDVEIQIPKLSLEQPKPEVNQPAIPRKRQRDPVYEYSISSDESEDEFFELLNKRPTTTSSSSSSSVNKSVVGTDTSSRKNWSGWFKLNHKHQKGTTTSHSCEALPLYDSEVEAVNRVLKYNSSLHVCGFLKVNDIREFQKYVQKFLQHDANRQFLLLRLRQPGGSALHASSNELWDQVVQNGTGRVGIVELGHLNGGKMYIVPPAKLVRARFPDVPIVTHFDQPGFDEDCAYGLAMWRKKVTSSDCATRHGDIVCAQSTARLRELHAAVEKGVKACPPSYTDTPTKTTTTTMSCAVGPSSSSKAEATLVMQTLIRILVLVLVLVLTP
jgi:hypothetical protein